MAVFYVDTNLLQENLNIYRILAIWTMFLPYPKWHFHLSNAAYINTFILKSLHTKTKVTKMLQNERNHNCIKFWQLSHFYSQKHLYLIQMEAILLMRNIIAQETKYMYIGFLLKIMKQCTLSNNFSSPHQQQILIIEWVRCTERNRLQPLLETQQLADKKPS